MFCPHCGAQAVEGATFCDKCGNSLSNEPPVAAPVAQAQPSPAAQPEIMSKRAYMKEPINIQIKKNINAAGIFCYFSAVATLIISGILGEINFIDPIILVLLGGFVQFGYSFIASIILLIYGIINMVVTTMNTGRFSGYLVFIAGIYAVSNTFKFSREYKRYKKDQIRKAQGQ